MDQLFFVMGALMALLGVAAGAFGAHALRSRLSAERLGTFETAVRYQMYHALGLFVVAQAQTQFPGTLTTASGWLLVGGIVLFSGSLYALCFTGIRWLGAITPLGGLAWLLGWALLALAALA